jgi:hypothetical protein
MLQEQIAGPMPNFRYESAEQRHTHCMEALRERFLDEGSTSDMIADEAERAGWSYHEVARAIDALVQEKPGMLAPSRADCATIPLIKSRLRWTGCMRNIGSVEEAAAGRSNFLLRNSEPLRPKRHGVSIARVIPIRGPTPDIATNDLCLK